MHIRSVRRIVRVAATVVGLALGLPLLPLGLAAMFTLRNEDLPHGIVALGTPTLLVPLVIGAAVKPREGGRALIAAVAVSAAAYLWSLIGASETSLTETAAFVGLYAAIAALGLAFCWSAADLQTFSRGPQ